MVKARQQVSLQEANAQYHMEEVDRRQRESLEQARIKRALEIAFDPSKSKPKVKAAVSRNRIQS